MDIQEHTTPGKLEYYAFVWLLLMLALSGIAMFLGAQPPIVFLLGSSVNAVWSLLNLSWIISGVATAYMLYQWNQNDRNIFGGKEKKDLFSFYFMAIVGLNIGITGILGTNIFLDAFYSADVILWVAGAACFAAAYQLYTAWDKNGKKVFK